MSTLTKRSKGYTDPQSPNSNISSSPTPPSSILSNLRWLVVILILLVLFAFVWQRVSVDSSTKKRIQQRLFTKDELKVFTKDELYLSILGHVFNVSSARRFYSETGSYGHFTGLDASRAFHTGGHKPDDLTDDLTGLDDEAIHSVYNWLLFYQKQYPQIGLLIGRYFDETGSSTKYFNQVLQSVEIMKKKENEKSQFEQKWPPCNSEWSHVTGRRVWCTEKSGGIERSWIGVPRRYFDAAAKNERCVCVKNPSDADQHFKEYPNCPSNSFECRLAD